MERHRDSRHTLCHHRRQCKSQHPNQIPDNLVCQHRGRIFACPENHDIHNSKAFYALLSKSVTGTICDTVFDKAKNLPTNEYCVILFKLFTSFTVVGSLQPSIISFNQITSFYLSTYDYNIPTINTKLTDLLLIARTPTHALDDS